VKILLREGINVNARICKNTALHQAASNGNHEIAKLLIAAGADVNQRISEGYFNPLLIAAYEGNLEVVRVLLEAGADVQVRVTDYLNPLEYAELGKWQGHKKGQPFDEVIELLKRYGATRSV
jgi:ankyrin repeat protein